FIVNQLENGTRYGFSVVPHFGNESGLASDGMFATPVSGSCPWTSDLGISALISPLSGRLHTSSAPSGTVRLEVRNFGNTNASNVASTLFFRKPDGTVSSQTLSLSVIAGQSQAITLPQTLNLLSPGQYPVEFWLVSTGDVNSGNDSLTTSISVFPNPVLSLPWQNSFETSPDFSVTSTSLGLPGNASFDFTSTNGARISSVLKQPQEILGTHSLILDKERIDGTTGNSDLILTLNLSDYQHPSQLILDFDWLPLGGISPDNSLWMRPDDQEEWVEVRRFSDLTYTIGTVSSIRGINLLSFLETEALTSSFQLKFTGAAVRSQDLTPGGGYAIDNLVLSMPGNDVVVLALTGPVENCYANSDVRKVKIRVANTGQHPAEHVQVGYKLVGQNPVSGQIDLIGIGDTVEYEFDQALPSDLYGLLKFKLWAFGNDDSYPTNDTLRNESVFLYPVVSGKSYYESFEANSGFWKGYGQNSSWEWGVPSKNLSVVDTAANGIKIWTTNLKGNYNNNELSFLQSPCLNLAEMGGDVQFSFNSVYNMESEYDHMWLEMSEDGIEWWKTGSTNSGTNWYNHGMPSWNGLRSHWEVASHRIAAESVANKARVRFRFAFSSDPSQTKEGFGIDDVHLEPAFEIVSDSSFSQETAIEEETWVSFGKLPDKVASIENSAELGNISMEMKINKGAVRMLNGKPYLDRNYLIVPENQPSVPVKVRLFVTDAEVKKLQTIDPGLESFQQLGIFKYDGANQDLDIDNNEYNAASSSVFIPAGEVLKVPTADGYFLEFQVDGFSEFYVSTRSLAGPETPLPVELISFTARNQSVKGEVLLEWKTASEINLNRFELASSCDGKTFDVIRAVSPQGSVSQGQTYRVVHSPASCNAESIVYKLQAFDNGQVAPTKELRAIVKNDRAGENPVRITNPVINHQIDITGLSGDPTQIQLLDATGRICFQTETSQTGFTQNISMIPSGVYSVQILSADHPQTFRILIR
ncbi:MAG TPA: T9SS type A sorting domain-containing protein, partial [Catalimonadaceae bacterium]|nr:T9SS type A sorting domain-containing protein [Catalimonadaceae bacterium]